MEKVWLMASVLGLLVSGCSTVATQESATQVRDSKCKVNPNIARNAIPKTPNNMSLPSFGRGIIGWGTGMDGAKTRLENVTQADVQGFKEKGVTLAMVQEWQTFYENETRRNDCNPTAPYRAQLMKKIAEFWVD
ncbi:DUF4951 domain-containing protein [Acinetobacter shaoyimingii]|uniref:DUF4951 domain-containing protein n=1 Tax=Acinetobacter shaoyimingii TaxID=2715164 RepID=A0A6G8RWM9_9GAMM|nr:DUF4951 domain-containing protein [Acinetobacter shaoyimingii]QIO06275.1 DUF4951 domain-containing protein [Acinetobacter shaoyimingii]